MQAEIRLCQALATEAGKAVSRARMAERLEEAYFSTLGALAAALEAKDAYTSDHAPISPSSPAPSASGSTSRPASRASSGWPRSSTTSARSASPR